MLGLNIDWQKPFYIGLIGTGEVCMGVLAYLLNHPHCAGIYLTDTRPDALNKAREHIASAFKNLNVEHVQLLPFADMPACLLELRSKNAALCISPGLSPHLPCMDIFYEDEARQKPYIPMMGELDVFFHAIKTYADYRPKCLAITGTNGKTTTTELCLHLLQEAGVRAVAAGNISPSMMQKWQDIQHQARDTWPEVWVLELSSFQLHYAHQPEFTAAAILNLTEDHLDWHGDMRQYAQAKAKIFSHPETIPVVPWQDPVLWAQHISIDQTPIYFAHHAPTATQIWGIIPQTESIAYFDAEQNTAIALLPAQALRIHGRHNCMNALASLALCAALGYAPLQLAAGLRSYVASNHRVEWLGQMGDIAVFDDSKGTNVGATQAALQSLGAAHRANIFLIAGGDAKGQKIELLADFMAQYVKCAYLIGKDKILFENICKVKNIPCQNFQTLEDATHACAQDAKKHGLTGDVVLLSPACASMDMFKNYAHRAQVFRGVMAEYFL